MREQRNALSRTIRGTHCFDNGVTCTISCIPEGEHLIIVCIRVLHGESNRGQMMLPLRHGGIGLHMQSDEVSDAAFVAGAGQAERNLKGCPAALCPLQGAGGASVRERWRSLHARYAEQCKWDAAAKDLPADFLDSKNGLLGAQQLARRKGDDACHADMLSNFDLNTTQGQRDAARLRSSSGGPAGAFLTAIPGAA